MLAKSFFLLTRHLGVKKLEEVIGDLLARASRIRVISEPLLHLIQDLLNAWGPFERSSLGVLSAACHFLLAHFRSFP